MGEARVVILVVLAVVAALLLVALGWWLFTRYAGTQSDVAARIPCGFRGAGEATWTVGVLGYDGTQLVHKAPVGRSLVVRHRWDRVRLDLGYAEHVTRMETAPVLPPDLTLVVRCGYRETAFDLALTEGHYTALRSWVEAAPPGWNANVA